ncbi:hypothetical protein NQ317_002997 [Molorchus minor]|uniref:Uncharacterized protein n=1 Tax=Molorchus minor TaxID=1323400 RepID=A0ABQ9JL61_9CUCU|nr:hypothetical protein NQ317_002997 [Molorchus minor]
MNAIFTGLFSSMIKMAENGNLDRLRKYWDARKPACIEAAKKSEIHVSFSEFTCGLLALSFGVCFSLIFLAVEILYFKKGQITNQGFIQGVCETLCDVISKVKFSH